MEPLRLVSAGELLDRHWRTMLVFYVSVFGFVSSVLCVGSTRAWPLAALAVPFAFWASRARGRLYVPEPGTRSSNSALALVAFGLALASLVYGAVTVLVVHLVWGAA